MKNHIQIILLASLLTACQSTTQEAQVNKAVYCNQADWSELGYNSALAAKSVRVFNSYKEDCNNTLPESAKETYLAGYTKGVKEYCSYENGYKLAELGLSNPSLCPLEMRRDFDLGYKAASKILEDQKEQAMRIADTVNKRAQANSAKIPARQ